MGETVLVTGGAGFIGRAVTRELLERGNRVRVLDALIEQVHPQGPIAAVEDPDIDFVHADIRNGEQVRHAMRGVDAVIHLAAEVGVGQSMYEIERYTSANDAGTAVLLECLIDHPVRRVVTASSMSIYGEGLYADTDGELVEDASRERRHKGNGGWDPVDADGRKLNPLPTPEWKRPQLSSIYALNKYFQEQATQITTSAYGIEGVCLRLFNVFGPGQALSNPYTGVLAIFSSRLLNRQPPVIFEDGEQRRDFVHVRDVARAFADALTAPDIAGSTINIGSGRDRSILEVAQTLAQAMDRGELEPIVTGQARSGDIRHCYCDTQLAREVLQFEAREDFGESLAELTEWVAGQTAQDKVDEARSELLERGLVA